MSHETDYLTPDGTLARAREALRRPEAERLAASMRGRGEQALTAGPFAVTDKTLIAPTGDPHDFVRLPTYEWPDPDTPDGRPYVHRDGERNPETLSPATDMRRLNDLGQAVEALAWAYLATGEERFAARAVTLLEVWFLRPETRMNPNLTYSKHTPGRDENPTGVIATHRWATMVQAFGILERSSSWSRATDAGLRAWFAEYLHWLETSDQGQAERAFGNNRGVWFEVQSAAYAAFAGDEAKALRLAAERGPFRIDQQVAEGGRLPAELRRTKSLSYSWMTLRGFAHLAGMAERSSSDLWNHRTADGRGLRDAIDYLLPFVSHPERWPHEQIHPVAPAIAVGVLLPAARAYGDPTYAAAVETVDFASSQATAVTAALFPPSAD